MIKTEVIPKNFTGIRTHLGIKEWYVGGKFHREDGPAVIWKDGEKEWLLHGHPIYRNTTLLMRPVIPCRNHEYFKVDVDEPYIVLETDVIGYDAHLEKNITFTKVMSRYGIGYIPNLPGVTDKP
jgi:hypothetical protein